MRWSGLLSESLQSTVSYEEGRTLIDAAVEQRDFAQRGRDLDLAVAKLKDLAASPSNPLAGSAALLMGNVIIERGRMALDASRRALQQTQKPVLIKQARDQFGQAGKIFGEAEARFKQKLDGFDSFVEKDPKNKGKLEARDQARAMRSNRKCMRPACCKKWPARIPKVRKIRRSTCSRRPRSTTRSTRPTAAGQRVRGSSRARAIANWATRGRPWACMPTF